MSLRRFSTNKRFGKAGGMHSWKNKHLQMTNVENVFKPVDELPAGIECIAEDPQSMNDSQNVSAPDQNVSHRFPTTWSVYH